MRVERSGIDWVLESVALLLVGGIFVYPLIEWPRVPDWIPVHFGASGAPDRWGSKSQLWLVPAGALVLYAAMTAATRFPRLVNLPFAVDRDSPEVQRLLLRLLGTVKVLTLAVLAYLVWSTVQVARGQSDGLSPLLLPVVLVGAVVPLIVFLMRLSRYRKR